MSLAGEADAQREIREAAERANRTLIRNRRLNATVGRQAQEIEDLRERLRLAQAIDSAERVVETWPAPKAGGAHRGTVCMVLSDTHYGEVVNPAEIDTLNAYNPKVALQRTRRTFERGVILARDYLKGVRYDGAVLFLGGDMVSGDIHDELSETNAETTAESVIRAAEPIEAGIRLWAEEFGRVQVAAVVGNHGRRTRKPRAKRRAADNMDWLLYQIIARDLRADKRIRMTVSPAADQHVTVYNTRYLLTHGDQFRGGSGISGMMAPLFLGQHRKTRRQNAAGLPYDWLVMGHWHQYWLGKGIIVSGALKGYDEYAYISNFEFEPPRLAWWVTTPERGVTFSAPVEPMDRRSEGW